MRVLVKCACAKGSIWYRHVPLHVSYTSICALVCMYMHACMFARMIFFPHPLPLSLPPSLRLSLPSPPLSFSFSFYGSIVRSLARSLHTLTFTLLI